MDGLPENIVIREFTKADRPLVEAFFNQMGGETRALFDANSANYKNAMRFFDDTVSNWIFFLAEYNGTMIGYLVLTDLNRSILGLGIAVHEEYKGRRLGRRLMQRAIDFARENNKGGIILTTHVVNLRGQGLYARMGFERIGMSNGGEALYLYRF